MSAEKYDLNDLEEFLSGEAETRAICRDDCNSHVFSLAAACVRELAKWRKRGPYISAMPDGSDVDSLLSAVNEWERRDAETD